VRRRLIKGRGGSLACGPRLGGVPEADSTVAREESGLGTAEVGDDRRAPRVRDSGRRRRNTGWCWAASGAGLRPATDGAYAG
jgi:hypothetical protein